MADSTLYSLVKRLLSSDSSKPQPVVIENADSKGVVLDYFGTPRGAGRNPYGVLSRKLRFEPREILKIVRNDPVVRAAILSVVDKVSESGWRIQGVDRRSRQASAEKKLRELRFDRLLRKIVFHLLLYNNAFVEIRKNGSEVTELNLLETAHMRIDSEDNGDVILYYQEVGNQQKRPEWRPEEIVHFKLDDFTTNVWSEPNVESLYETILIKDYARQFMEWFWATNQARPIIKVQNAGEQKFREFMAYLKAAQQNIDRPVPVEVGPGGDVSIEHLLSPAVMEWVLEVQKWCDDQIRILLQVPPLALGMTDTSGRSDGAEQRQYLYTRVYAIQKLLEDEMTFDMFPKMGYEKVEFSFGVLDETVRTRIFETVQMMRNSQFTEEAIQEYLESQGAVFDTDKVLYSMDDIQQLSNKDLGTGNEGMKGNKSADAAQSRQRQNDEDLSKKNREGQQK